MPSAASWRNSRSRKSCSALLIPSIARGRWNPPARKFGRSPRGSALLPLNKVREEFAGRRVFFYTKGLGLLNRQEAGGITQMTQGMKNSRGRLILVALILVLGAFWVGARYGPKQAEKVEARHIAAEPTGL